MAGKADRESRSGGVIRTDRPDERLRPALEAISERDPDFARAWAACGLPPYRHQEPGFAGLVRIIAAQQVSASTAAAIIARLHDVCEPLEPGTFLALEEDALRGAGLSRPKIRYARLLAEALQEGTLNLDELHSLPDDALTASLTSLKGIGRWTADVYMLFALHRPDVWPVGDLAVRVAAAHLKGYEGKPDPAWLEALGENWRPWRSAAALFLWHYYRHPQGGGVSRPASGMTDVPG